MSNGIPNEIRLGLKASGMSDADIQMAWDIASHATEGAFDTLLRRFEAAGAVAPHLACVYSAMAFKMVEANAVDLSDKLLEQLQKERISRGPAGEQAMKVARERMAAELKRYGIDLSDLGI